MNAAPAACPRCRCPQHCPGSAGHHLHDQIAALPLSREEFAALLHCGYDDVALQDAGALRALLRRLPLPQLEHLAELLGTTPATLLTALTDSPPARAQPCGDPDLLHALLLHSGPHGAAPASITAALAWTLDRLEAAARTLRQSPPCPAVRLITTSGGDLALRANPDLLPAAVQNHTVDPDSDAAELDEYLLASLRRLLTDPLETIPHRHRQQLYERHLITVDADGAHLAPDVHFSLTHAP